MVSFTVAVGQPPIRRNKVSTTNATQTVADHVFTWVNATQDEAMARHERWIPGSGGLVLSLCASGMQPSSTRTSQRQWLMSALTSAVVVGEAAVGSRAVNTHRVEGRPLSAVPGPITSSMSMGTNTLNRDGAAWATSVDDITAALARP